jgi:hypothetical protein
MAGLATSGRETPASERGVDCGSSPGKARRILMIGAAPAIFDLISLSYGPSKARCQLSLASVGSGWASMRAWDVSHARSASTKIF